MVQQRFSALDRIQRRWEPTFEEMGSAKIPSLRDDSAVGASPGGGFGALDGLEHRRRRDSFRAELETFPRTSSRASSTAHSSVVQDLVPLPHSISRLGGLPTCTDAGAIAAAALETSAASRAPGGNLIVMPGPLEGGNLGLAIHQLQVTGITDPAASSFGWSIGDRILSINGVAVSSQEQLRVAVHYALQEFAAYQKPLSFEVSHGSAATAALAAGGGSSASSARRQKDDCCCCWWFGGGESRGAAQREAAVPAASPSGYSGASHMYAAPSYAHTETTASSRHAAEDLYGYGYADHPPDPYQFAKPPAISPYAEAYPYLPGIPADWDFEESKRRRDALCV